MKAICEKKAYKALLISILQGTSQRQTFKKIRPRAPLNSCPVCGLEFTRKQWGRRKFCSVECSELYWGNWQFRTPEQKAKKTEASKRWQIAHPEAYKKILFRAQKRWRITHPEAYKAINRRAQKKFYDKQRRVKK